jgi:hypothetical protein
MYTKCFVDAQNYKTYSFHTNHFTSHQPNVSIYPLGGRFDLQQNEVAHLFVIQFGCQYYPLGPLALF